MPNKPKGNLNEVFCCDTTFGMRLEIIRERNNLTIKDMAQSVGVAAQTWRSYEKEVTHPALQTQRLFCETYDVNPDWLFTGQGEIEGYSSEKFGPDWIFRY